LKYVENFDYRTEDGTLLYQVRKALTPDGDKCFVYRRPDGRGGWRKGIGGVRRILYGLRELCSRPNDQVFIPEGEKDVDTLKGHGFLAVCNPNGAGNWRSEFSSCLQSRDVVVICDSDRPGRDHGQDVARKLWGFANSIRIVDLFPDRSDGSDISDWLNQGNTPADLQKIVSTTVPISTCPDEEITSKSWTEKSGTYTCNVEGEISFIGTKRDVQRILSAASPGTFTDGMSNPKPKVVIESAFQILAHANNGEPVYLSTRLITEIYGIPKSTAAYAIRGLVSQGTLLEVEPGTAYCCPKYRVRATGIDNH